MFLGRNLRIASDDSPIGTDNVSDPLRKPSLWRVAGPVSHSDRPIHVAQEQKGKSELRRKGRVLLHRVKRNAQNLDLLLLVLGGKVAEPATLRRSPGRIRHRIEPQNDCASGVVGEAASLAGMVLDFEVGSRIADPQHARAPPPAEHPRESYFRPSVRPSPSNGGAPLRSSQSLAHFKKTP